MDFRRCMYKRKEAERMDYCLTTKDRKSVV